MNRVQQLCPAENAAGLSSHSAEELKLGLGQIDGSALNAQPHARNIELNVAYPDEFAWRLGGFASAQH